MDKKQLQKIDALSAEHILHWTYHRSAFFSPSTDIAAAWKLMAKFDFRFTLSGPGAPIASGEYRNSVKGWRCEIDDPDNEYNTICVYAATAPLAICMCALAVKGIDVIKELSND